jgi:hypothetical protein
MKRRPETLPKNGLAGKGLMLCEIRKPLFARRCVQAVYEQDAKNQCCDDFLLNRKT